MEHAKNVRSPSLVGGTNYVMKSWTKTYTYSEVKFIGFLAGTVEYKCPNKQLKDMLPTDFYKFTSAEGSFRGKMLDNCLVHETTETRITFLDVAGTVRAPKVNKTPKVVATVVETVVETPVVETVVETVETVETLAPAETALERKRRLDAERKRNKRLELKNAKLAIAA